MIAIALALQTAPATVTGIDDAVARALTTLRQVMPARLRAASDAFEVTSLRNYWQFSAPPIDVATLQIVGAAIRTSHTLRFDYATPEGDTPRPETLASIHPERLNRTTWSCGPAAGTSSPETGNTRHGPPTASTESARRQTRSVPSPATPSPPITSTDSSCKTRTAETPPVNGNASAAPP